MTNKEKLEKIQSLRLYLEAHPDNEENSECADRLEDVIELEKYLKNEIDLKQRLNNITILLSTNINIYHDLEEEEFKTKKGAIGNWLNLHELSLYNLLDLYDK